MLRSEQTNSGSFTRTYNQRLTIFVASCFADRHGGLDGYGSDEFLVNDNE